VSTGVEQSLQSLMPARSRISQAYWRWWRKTSDRCSTGYTEEVERAEVLHHELLLQSCSGTLEKLQAQGGEDDVIDVEQHISSVGAMTVDEQRDVRLGLHEAQGDQVGGEAVVPCSRRLLQAVEGLVEPAHQLRVRKVNETGGLRAVDGLRVL
jgi:hypothetical protein